MGILDRLKATMGAATKAKGRGGKSGGTAERNVGGRIAGLRGRKGRRRGGPESPAPGGGENERNVGG
ncbi:hypothetical protein [Blastococcus sp. CT_GayMR16]|uniref:hypothetical protein n=1 Tax=Blastococcus sp. CT_GayMR16 TaxID=2559607 RepID=UPI0010731E5E|nr:hypothetical protein [Blastococcus sp. CT_GayMR16]TFV90541.1 hypothetical protein E4P38_03725 [Blastococcus sp. CT_GayMR16]